MLQRRSIILSLCALLFIAAVWGSVYCGQELREAGLCAAREEYLWRLIYFHFALSQLALLGALACYFWERSRARRAQAMPCLLVSYKPSGMCLTPPGNQAAAEQCYRSCLGQLSQHPLPPCGAPVLVYPLFMQSGYSSGERLVKELKAAYATNYPLQEPPRFIMQPVLGASPWLAECAAEKLRAAGAMAQAVGVLIIAHGRAAHQEPAPEPSLFVRRVRQLMPGCEVELAYFGRGESVEHAMRRMRCPRVLVLPFLLSEGFHSSHDLPTPELAAACGKQLTLLPVIGKLL